MKKILLAIVLTATAAAVAQTASAPSQPAGPPQAAPQQKNEEALEQLMGSYQVTNNVPKMIETAQKVLQVNPNNLKALALLVFAKRATAKTPQDLADAAQYGKKGLQVLPTWPKPEGMSDADYQKFKTRTGVIFYGAMGMAAYQNKDNAKAEQYLRAAVEGDPTDVNNIYPLALAYLTPGPAEKPVDGLFFIARAANLIADPKAKADVTKFGRSRYVKYHGSDEGWPDLMARAKANSEPVAADTDTDTEGASSNEVAPPNVEGSAAIELEEGQTPEQVEKLLGKPADRMTLKGSLIYIYPTVKVIFENGKLVDVQYQQK